ncbi:hypothetical protein D8674_009231 [Pyrus ussuriensis x Pyrus communis]|uniref:Uncharacterized protein n=1 Tax=Pyrus ussuriensis x Pyrus communis TaxID=2448454 RepID=A0A5N5I002_9ROSA|nr:hypothetical protein D8674_009231 [Pyrus ussuriensis x Pyrus communis]
MFAALTGLVYFLSNSLAIEVATTMLLLVLSGPVKALTYLVRSLGAVGYVLISSFLISENILALITLNIHASLTFIFTASGIYSVPSMEAIYASFGYQRILHVLAPPTLFGVPYEARDESIITIAKMAGEGYII